MDSMEVGQFITFSKSFFHYEICSSNFALKNICGRGNFTKDINWYFFTILHGANNGGSHSKVFLNPLMHGGNKRLLYLNKPTS